MEVDNVLIAEFLEAPKSSYRVGDKIHWNYQPLGVNWYQPDNMKFHLSWDWLMKAVVKISAWKESADSFFVMVEITSSYTRISCMGFSCIVGSYLDSAEELKEDSSIKATYKAVSNFIRYYNVLSDLDKVGIIVQ